MLVFVFERFEFVDGSSLFVHHNMNGINYEVAWLASTWDARCLLRVLCLVGDVLVELHAKKISYTV